MSSPSTQPNLILTQRLADGTIEWLPLETSQRVAVDPGAAYALIDRANYEAPTMLVARRQGEDLVVEVNETDVLVLDGFFTAQDVAFHPTTDVAGGAGPFSGSPITPATLVLAGSPEGEQVVWSAEPDTEETIGQEDDEQQGGGVSPLVWGGLAVGGLGIAALAGGGGGGGGSGGSSTPTDTTAPTITSDATAATIDENSGAGQVVYTATATDAGTVTWSLASGGDAAAFNIDANSGAVTLLDDPDFEAQASYTFTVVATDRAGNSSQQTISLSIQDQDDTAPVITTGATADAIGENTGAGQIVYTAEATDEGTVTWSLASGGDAAAFSIDADSGAVTLINNPDFETQSSYTFTVVATDDAGNSDELSVSLAIEDRDDSSPFITSGATAADIDENSGNDQVIYTATATDEGTVTWSLDNSGDATAFNIDTNTGEVTLLPDPDFEAQSSYAFTVIATDNEGNTSQQAVSLAINDLDENAPVITSGATAAAIDENSGAGQAIYDANATDEGTVTWSLAPGGNSAAFGINPNTGIVTLIGNPDFEAQSSYTFTVVATDNAGNSSQQAVSLAINDLDENAPVITSGATATAIDENSGAGQTVYDANATDEGTVTWSLASGGNSTAFSINPNTGIVTLIGNPDFETQSSYTFTVVATDNASNSSQQTVSLAINNVDEIAPTVSGVALTGAIGALNNTLNAGDTVQVTVTMSENTIVNTTGGTPRIALNIGSSTAFANYVSGSGGTALVFAYTVQAGDTDTNGISISPNSLQLNGGSITDAASNPASLGHGPVGNNASFLVDTTAPSITSGASAITIDENSGAGRAIYDANATDTGTVTWSLSGTDATAFGINPISGVVTLTADPDFETQSSYAFNVVATDAAGNASQQAVSLAINDLDESGPAVSGVALTGAIGALNNTLNAGDTVQVTVTMSENTIVNTTGGTPRIALNIGSSTAFANYVSGSGGTALVFAYTVQAGDTDTNGISISPDSLELNGGSITDAASNPASLGHGPVGDNASFLVDTTAPSITSGASAITIDENSGAGRAIYDANATDTGTVTWSLSGTDATAFGINPISGVVTLTADPDFETQSSYAFNVIATDAAGNASQQGVTLSINDVDEIAPTLTTSTPSDNATDIPVGENIVLTFSENVQTGSGNITISDGSDTRIIDITDGTQVSISGNQVTINPTTDLNAGSSYNVRIDSGALTDAEGNSYTGINDGTTLNFDTAVDTSIVVFDLVQGSSSDHSSRTFQVGVSYDIYIRVDSDDFSLGGISGGERWDGAANLGSDDRIILVGDGSAIQGPTGPLTQVAANATAVAWQSSTGTAAGLTAGGSFTRAAGGGTDSTGLFNTALPGSFLSNQGSTFLVSIPAGILTSQGLV